MEEKIKKELALYRAREVEIEDLKLKIKELEVGEQIGTSGFEERVQTSMKCKNNDNIMLQIDTLKKKIKANEIANARVDNALRIIKDDDDFKVITMVCIDKMSISNTARELFKTRRQIEYTLDRALKALKIV